MSDEACSWQLKGSNISEIRCAIYTCQDKLFLYSNVQHVGHCPVELPSCNKISPASFMLINEIQALMGIDPSLEEKKRWSRLHLTQHLGISPQLLKKYSDCWYAHMQFMGTYTRRRTSEVHTAAHFAGHEGPISWTWVDYKSKWLIND